MKRVISFLLALVLLLSVNVVNAQEIEEGKTYLLEEEVKDNNVSYSFAKGVLTVKGTGVADKSYIEICKKKEIKKLVIQSGITAIADDAFSGCKNMASVEIPKTVVSIGHRAFQEDGLTSLTIPKSVKNIGYVPFRYNNKLKKVTMPGTFRYVIPEDYDHANRALFGEGVQEIHLNTAFEKKMMGFYLADKIYLAKGDKKYKSVQGVIYTKNRKTLIMVPYSTKELKIRKGCTTVNVSAIAYSYNPDDGYIPYCEKLKQVTIPASVKKIVNDLDYFTNLSVFYKTKFVVKSKKLTGSSIENLFQFVSEKTKNQMLSSSKFGIQKKNQMYISRDKDLLGYVGNATTVTIPKNIKRIGNNAFSGKKLKSVKIPKKVSSIGEYAFYGCKNLKKVTWNKKVKTVGDWAFAQTKIQTLKLPASVKSWGENCFTDCSVKKLQFPKTMKRIPERMFSGLNIKKLVIPGTVQAIGPFAFAQCRAKTVVFKEGVKTIGRNAFDETVKMKSVVIPKSVETIEDGAFQETEIETLTLKNPKVKIGKDAFYFVKEFVLDTNPENYFTFGNFQSHDEKGNFNILVVKVKNASGLEIECSTNKDFSNAKTFTVENKTKEIELKTGMVKDVYSRIRPYTNVNGQKIYGQWMVIK